MNMERRKAVVVMLETRLRRHIQRQIQSDAPIERSPEFDAGQASATLDILAMVHKIVNDDRLPRAEKIALCSFADTILDMFGEDPVDARVRFKKNEMELEA